MRHGFALLKNLRFFLFILRNSGGKCKGVPPFPPTVFGRLFLPVPSRRSGIPGTGGFCQNHRQQPGETQRVPTIGVPTFSGIESAGVRSHPGLRSSIIHRWGNPTEPVNFPAVRQQLFFQTSGGARGHERGQQRKTFRPLLYPTIWITWPALCRSLRKVKKSRLSKRTCRSRG